MRAYQVQNRHLLPSLGQTVKVFETLSDVVLARICMAVDDYNNADTSWMSPDSAAGERTQRDATATIQGVLDGLENNEERNRAIREIQQYCDDADAILDTVRKPGPGTVPFTTYNPPVATGDTSRDLTPPPPPPNEYPPVATGERGPGRGAFGYRPSVQSGLPGPGYTPPVVQPTGFTGSEPESPPEPEPVPTGQTLPPPPPPMPPARPSVATPSVGCWYVMGKGYVWGDRPSGGETTGLNQQDCERIAQGYRDVSTPSGQTAPQTAQVPSTAPAGNVNSTPSWNTAPGATRPPDNSVASTDCDTSRGLFPDGHGGCRSSVSMPNLPGIPGGSGGMTAPSSVSDFSSYGASATSFMGRRRVALRGVHSNGNLEWWSYQQAFLPPLYFSRPRARYATLARPQRTLGVGKPVPPGICCQATPDGGAICSTGQGFPPDCPNKPEPNVPGVAEYIQQGGYMVPKPPPVPVNGVCPAPVAAASGEKPAAPAEGGSGIAPVIGLAVVGALLYALTGN